MKLTDDEIKRYDRHLKLSGFGLEKQLQLKEARILIVGAGGLGCPIALYLAASGVGNITIVDDDKIELSNLQRQIAFSVNQIGQFKATALAQKISSLNPLVKVNDVVVRIEASNVEKIISGYDLIIDGTDNFATRFLIADACYLAKIPYLHASVYQYQGQVFLSVPGKTACFRCLFKQAPQTSALPACGEAGILGVVVGPIGLMAATEAVKYLTGLGDSIAGKVLIYNILQQELKKFNLEQDNECVLCSKKATIKEIDKNNGNDRASCEQNNVQERLQANEYIISIDRANELIKQNTAKNNMYLLDVREGYEYEQGHLDNAIFLPLSLLQSMPIDVLGQELKSKLNLADDGEQIVLCYCQRGTRSLKATKILRQSGIANTFSVEGGLEAWTTN